MGLWSYYFLGKLMLVAGGYLQAHLVPNLALALFTALPLRRRGARVLKELVAIPAGAALLYYDTWFPPLTRLWEQSDALAEFNRAYLLELLLRFVDLRVVLALVLLFGLLWLLSRKVRLSTLALIGILLSPMLARWSAPAVDPTLAHAADTIDPGAVTPADLDKALEAFYLKEKSRRVLFPASPATAPGFDLVMLHVCSLAWDDLDAAGLRQHPLFQRLNLRFTRFNSAASYSGPAAIRVLHSACGQPSHEGLYQPTDPNCLLMNRLAGAGFQPQLALNHDGRFGNFLEGDIRERGGLRVTPEAVDTTPVILREFDNSPIHDDYAVLEQWWKRRLTLDAPQVALYYNTATLHDGNHFLDGERLSPLDSYRKRAIRLFDELNRFLSLLESSQRRVVVALIPEHGANVRGDRMQISGLREIPSPGITLVPAGVAVLGAGSRPAAPAVNDTPTGVMAMAQLFAQFIDRSPYAPDAPPLSAYSTPLAQTPFVAENDGAIVMAYGGRWWLRNPDRRWMEYRTDRRQ